MTPRSVGKTVYILGAGFSAPAGGPDQASLLRLVLDLEEGDGREVRRAKRHLEVFLGQRLGLRGEAQKYATLEDVFTPIDRCLADGVALRGMAIPELQTVRSALQYLISRALQGSFDRRQDRRRARTTYVKTFARHLVRLAQVRSELAMGEKWAHQAKAHDPVSVVSLNWDILLDRALHQALAEMTPPDAGDYSPIGVVDYCCYVSSLDRGDWTIKPGLWALGARGFNLKLLKIHGSMNWLQCSNCQRLFVAFDQKWVIPNFEAPGECRHCRAHGVVAALRSALVMPTFLKDLQNFQIKLIWQNAGVELMEARKLVFIGYSLPMADFEFRQLLGRMVSPSAELEVVLFRRDKSASEKRKIRDEENRYRQFFGKRMISFRHDGVEAYVEDLCGNGFRK